MQFEIQKSSLEQELSLLVGITGRRDSSIASISTVAIDVTDSKAKLTASDFNVTLITEAEATVTQVGSACIPAGRLLDIVKLASAGAIKISLMDNGWVKIKTESSTFKLPAIARDQFPDAPVVKSEISINVPSKILSQLISRTAFAVSKQEGNYALQNLKLDVAASSIKMTATDGQRVAIAESILSEQTEELQTLIPNFTASQLLRLAENYNDNIGIQLSENHLHFQFGKRLLVSTLTTGEFPDCELLLPKAITASVEFSTERLVLAIRRAALMSRGRSITLDFAQGTISATDADKGEMQEVMPTDVRLPLVILFNYQFLLDVLENIKTDRIILDLQSKITQAQLRPAEEKEGSNFLAIIMPMRSGTESDVVESNTEEPGALSLD